MSNPRIISFVGDRSADLSSTWISSSNIVYSALSGNVGVGITNPSRKLDVSGTMFVSGNITSGSINGVDFNLWQSGGSGLYYNSGNVGIGKSIPVANLDICGQAITSNLTVKNNASITSSTLDVSGNMNSGKQTVSNPTSVPSFNVYGNAAFSRAVNSVGDSSGVLQVQGGIWNKGKMLINKTQPSNYNVDISGDVFAFNSLVSDITYSPLQEVFRVYDLPTNESTTYSPYLSTFFACIDLDRNVVINSYSGGNTGSFYATGGSAYLPTVFKLDNGVYAEKIYTTSTNIYVLTTIGTVYAMGHNSQGNCGIGGTTTSPISYLTRAFSRDASNNLITEPIVKIIHSEFNAITFYVITQSGKLYAAGNSQYGQLGTGVTGATNTGYPNLVNIANVVDAVAIGSYDGANNPQTLAVLDSAGAVWTVGYGERGQMGRGNYIATNTSIGRVNVSTGGFLTNITKIYGYGGDSTTGFMALNSTGDLFVWGRNKVAMSFNNTSVDISSATRVNSFIDSLNTPLISRVWTGTHDDGDIFVQATNGLVYGTGLGFSLGINNSANNGWKQITFFNTTTRYLVELYTGCTDTSVQKATAFAITRDTTTNEYTLWATGLNIFGQLGTGSSGEAQGDIINWFEITFPSGLVKRIKRIISSSHGTRPTDSAGNPISPSLGTGNTYILLDSGEVYYSGKDVPLRNVDRIITPFQLLTVNYTPEYN